MIILFAGNWILSLLIPEQMMIQQNAIGVSLAFYLIILQFFRNPVFTVVKNDKQILAPADGKVVVIEEAEVTEYLKGRRKQISIFTTTVVRSFSVLDLGCQATRYLPAWYLK